MDLPIKAEKSAKNGSSPYVRTATAPASLTVKNEANDGEETEFQSDIIRLADDHAEQGHQRPSTPATPGPPRLQSPLHVAKTPPSEKKKGPIFSSEEKAFLILWRRRGLVMNVLIPKFEATFKKNLDETNYKGVITHLEHNIAEIQRLLSQAAQYSWFEPWTERYAKSEARFDKQAEARTRLQQGKNTWATNATAEAPMNQTLRPRALPPDAIFVTRETTVTYSRAPSPGASILAHPEFSSSASDLIQHCGAPKTPSLSLEPGNSPTSDTATYISGDAGDSSISETTTIHPGDARNHPRRTSANDSPGSTPAVAIWIDSEDDEGPFISPNDPFTRTTVTPTHVHTSRLPPFAQQTPATALTHGPIMPPETVIVGGELPHPQSSMQGIQLSDPQRGAQSFRKSAASAYLDGPSLDPLTQYSSMYLTPLPQYEDQLQPPTLNVRRAAPEVPQPAAQASRSRYQAGAYLNSPSAGVFPVDVLNPGSRGTEHRAEIVKQALAKKQAQLKEEAELQREAAVAKQAQREKEARFEMQARVEARARPEEPVNRHNSSVQGRHPLPNHGIETRDFCPPPSAPQVQGSTQRVTGTMASLHTQTPIYLSLATVQILNPGPDDGLQAHEHVPEPNVCQPSDSQPRGPRPRPQYNPQGQSLYNLDHLHDRSDQPNIPTSNPLSNSPAPDTNTQPHLAIGMFPYQRYTPSTAEGPSQHPPPDSNIPRPELGLDAAAYDPVTGMHIRARNFEGRRVNRSTSPDAMDAEKARKLEEKSWFDEGEHHREWDA